MSYNIVSISFSAIDGSSHSMNGLVDEDQLKDLRELEKAFPKLFVLTAVSTPVSFDLLDYTRLWLCGKDEEIHEKLYDLSVAEFATAVREELVQVGYQEP